MVVFDKLNERQKAVLLAAAKRMMVADARIFKEEMVFFTLMQDQLSSEQDAEPSGGGGELDFSVFDDPRSQRILIFSLNVMAFADGHYHPKESEMLTSICSHFDLPADELEELLALASRQGRLISEITQALEGG